MNIANENLYFAYGSNLLEREVRKQAAGAVSRGVAFLPGYRFEFTKHSTTRCGDAASVQEEAGGKVWGYVYQMSDADKARLVEREKGYLEIPVTVCLKDGEQFRDQRAFTFIGKKVCLKQCGPSQDYFELVLEGARQHEFPATYIAEIEARRRVLTAPSDPAT